MTFGWWIRLQRTHGTVIISISIPLISFLKDRSSLEKKLFLREVSGLPEVAVCGPSLYYFQRDYSMRLIEWLEIMKTLAVSKVFLYETDVHPNMKRVLQFYERQGFVEIIDFQYPAPYPDVPLLRRYSDSLKCVLPNKRKTKEVQQNLLMCGTLQSGVPIVLHILV